jgi:hypothetical protein
VGKIRDWADERSKKRDASVGKVRHPVKRRRGGDVGYSRDRREVIDLRTPSPSLDRVVGLATPRREFSYAAALSPETSPSPPARFLERFHNGKSTIDVNNESDIDPSLDAMFRATAALLQPAPVTPQRSSQLPLTPASLSESVHSVSDLPKTHQRVHSRCGTPCPNPRSINATSRNPVSPTWRTINAVEAEAAVANMQNEGNTADDEVNELESSSEEEEARATRLGGNHKKREKDVVEKGKLRGEIQRRRGFLFSHVPPIEVVRTKPPVFATQLEPAPLPQRRLQPRHPASMLEHLHSLAAKKNPIAEPPARASDDTDFPFADSFPRLLAVPGRLEDFRSIISDHTALVAWSSDEEAQVEMQIRSPSLSSTASEWTKGGVKWSEKPFGVRAMGGIKG